MPVGYYSGTYTQTIFLRSIYNPATVSPTGVINVNSSVSGIAGVLGTVGPAVFTLINNGTVQSVGSLGLGVDLQSGGFVTNNGGLIQGTGQGVEITGGTGTVTNSGLISQTGTAGFNAIFLGGGGTVTNTGTVSAAGTNASAVQFGVGGKIVNGTLGKTLGLISAYHIGVGFFPGTAASPGAVTSSITGRSEARRPALRPGPGSAALPCRWAPTASARSTISARSSRRKSMAAARS